MLEALPKKVSQLVHMEFSTRFMKIQQEIRQQLWFWNFRAGVFILLNSPRKRGTAEVCRADFHSEKGNAKGFYLNAATTINAITETKETSNMEEPEETPSAVFVPVVTPGQVKAAGIAPVKQPSA